MKEWKFEVDINFSEYFEMVSIVANKVEQIGPHSLKADGVIIEFSGEVNPAYI